MIPAHKALRLVADFLFPQRAIYRLENHLMEALDTLNAKLEELATSNANLKAQVEEGNAKGDALITAVGVVLVRLKELSDAANQGGNVTAADIDAVTAKVQAVLDEQTAAVGELNAQDAELDTATAAATAATAPAPEPAPAPAPAPEPAPAPPQDDAFVAVGSTRISDGQIQTEETKAAVVLAWNAAHPEGPVAS